MSPRFFKNYKHNPQTSGELLSGEDGEATVRGGNSGRGVFGCTGPLRPERCAGVGMGGVRGGGGGVM